MISLSVKAENERMRWGLYGAGDGFYIKNKKKWPSRGKQDSWQGLAGPALPCPALPCPALPCPALPCPALLSPAQPCPALPCPALPCPAKPCQLSCFPLRGFFFFFGVSKPRHEPKLNKWVPGSEHHAPTRNKARRRESARLEHTHSHTLTWKQDMMVVSGLCHKTHEWRQTKVTEPWHYPPYPS